MIDQIKFAVKKNLANHPKRYHHILRVTKMSLELAKLNQVDLEKMEIAALFHDYCKNDSLANQLKYLTAEEIVTYADFPVMYHALAAAHVLETKFDYHDLDVIKAIKVHVWGSVDMNIMSKILVICDKGEPKRKHGQSEIIKKLALHDLDKALELGLRLSNEYIIKQGQQLHPDQLQTYEYYKKKAGII